MSNASASRCLEKTPGLRSLPGIAEVGPPVAFVGPPARVAQDTVLQLGAVETTKAVAVLHM
jgi:hypothetical protein